MSEARTPGVVDLAKVFSTMGRLSTMGTSRNVRAELVLHPLRMRILSAIGGQSLATRELAAVLPDVAQATLYRQLTTLVDGGVLDVVEERRVRGAVERIYALPEGRGLLGPEDLAEATREEHFRYFATFVAGLMGEFSRYLDRDNIDLPSDGVTYRQAVLHLDDEEYAQFHKGLVALLRPLLDNERSPQRTPRLVANVVVPMKPSRLDQQMG